MFKHLLIPTDGSDLGTKALRAGIDLAKVLGAEVTLITVSQPFHLVTAEDPFFLLRILGTGETEDRLPYIAMDLVDGRSLKEIIAADAPMAPGRASNLIHQLLRALGSAHRSGIVHRDMKPDNIRVQVDEPQHGVLPAAE